MAKESGMGWTAATVDDSGGNPRAIVNDFTSVNFSTPRAVADITGLDKSAIERLLLLSDFSVEFGGVFNDASNMSHAVFATVSSTSVNRTVTLTVSAQILAVECVFTDYALNRPQTGELGFTAPGMLTAGAVPTWTT